jgi:hypothetical protein
MLASETGRGCSTHCWSAADGTDADPAVLDHKDNVAVLGRVGRRKRKRVQLLLGLDDWNTELA